MQSVRDCHPVDSPIHGSDRKVIRCTYGSRPETWWEFGISSAFPEALIVLPPHKQFMQVYITEFDLHPQLEAGLGSQKGSNSSGIGESSCSVNKALNRPIAVPSSAVVISVRHARTSCCRSGAHQATLRGPAKDLVSPGRGRTPVDEEPILAKVFDLMHLQTHLFQPGIRP